MPLLETREPINQTWYTDLPPRSVEFRATSLDELRAITNLRYRVNTYAPNSLPQLDNAIAQMLNAHYGQKRLSGEPYSMHLLIPSIRAAEMALEPDIVVAELFHDAHDDTNYHIEDIKDNFGPRVAGIDEAVAEVRGHRKHEHMAFNLLNALISSPEAIIVRGLEQEHNSETLSLHPPEKREEIYKRTAEFTVPLIHAFGMKDVARRIMNNSAFATYPEGSGKIIDFADQENLYTDESAQNTLNIIARALKIKGGKLNNIEVTNPNLHDLLQITEYGNNLEKERMIFHCDIAYEGDRGEAAAYYERLFEKFGEPQVRDSQNGFSLKPPAKNPIEELIIQNKLEFYQNVNGRLVHFRLIPKNQYDFERISLIPLFQSASPVRERKHDEAYGKLERWRKAWRRMKRKQAKSITVKEFLRFLEGEESVLVRTPETAKFPKMEYELPVGSTVYDLIAGLPITSELKEKMLLYVTKAIVSKGKAKQTISRLKALPTDVLVTVITGDKPTFDENVFDLIKTENGFHQARKLARKLMSQDHIWIEKFRTKGRQRLLDAYKARTGAEKLDVPLKEGLLQIADRYKSKDDRVVEKHGKEFISALEQLFLEEIALHAVPENIMEIVVNSLVEYRNSLHPIAVEVDDKIGVFTDYRAIFARLGINIIRDTAEYLEGDKVRLTVYIDPKDAKDTERMSRLQQTIDTFLEEWKGAHS